MAPPPRLNLALSSSVGAPRRARHAIVELLAKSGRTDLAADAALLVSELVTNAVIHAGGPITLAAGYADNTLRVDIHDTVQAQLPDPKKPSAPHATGRTTGQGLHVVARLADRWGVTPTRDGKVVWFEVS